MGRSPCCEKEGLKKGPWTPEEDQKLVAFIEEHGHGSWRALPARAGLQRCGKSCRLRWTNYLRPDIKRGKFTMQEEQTIIQLHALLGNRWSAIATHLPMRTDNEIKNYWNTHLKKRLLKMGIDPATHKPVNALGPATSGHSKTFANLNHTAQWESARLEAEARLAQASKTCANTPTISQPYKKSTSSEALSCLDMFHGRQQKIDIESPKSTISYSDHNAPGMIPAARFGFTNEGEMEGEGGEWNLTGTQRIEESMSMQIDRQTELWLPGFSDLGLGTAFTELLLGGNEPNNGQSGSCQEQGEDENKNYWNGILNFESDSSPSVF